VLKRTYLEHFVFTGLLGAAAAKETAERRSIMDKWVDEIDLTKRPLSSYLQDRTLSFLTKQGSVRTFVSDYARLRFILRLIDARWRKFERRGLKPGTIEYNTEKERVLRSHWRAFFGGSKVGYTL